MKKQASHIDPMVFSQKLAQQLRVLRSHNELTQEAVAYRAGISTYTYQKFEKGESKPGTPMNPRLFTLIALANVFDISLQELLDFDSHGV
ncbi:helix-turn-helix domain-containing protein [Adlercreutzia caecimuris]|uniref:helix-turn-helix domain-containing protein n=1 Tax=Adlercreutzia caecimuris TaxID=671266 RepID=UPI001C3C3482|nr:helix-turn-helix transcriptional regulator [Adlercreutzia caecimuris]MCR2037367.1 helix-turn-helix domain-containing protein [Adlercreutzia caecimuris]